MGFLFNAIAVGLVLKTIGDNRREKKEEQIGDDGKEKREEQIRNRKACRFNGNISEETFQKMAQDAGKGIKRIKSIEVFNAKVFGIVRSQSGISEWAFIADFNDYGRLTGRYWLYSDNSDSTIPRIVADRIKQQIEDYPEYGDLSNDNHVSKNGNKKDEDYQKQRKRNVTDQTHGVGITSDQCENMRFDDVLKLLTKQKFRNIHVKVLEDLYIEDAWREGMVEAVSFNGIIDFDERTQFPLSSNIIIYYHTLQRVRPPLTSAQAKNMHFDDVARAFLSAGFVNIEKIPILDEGSWIFAKGNTVGYVTINENQDYLQSDRIRIDAKIRIYFHI